MPYKAIDEEKFEEKRRKTLLLARRFFGSDEKVCQAVNEYLEQQKRLGKHVEKDLKRSTLCDSIRGYRPVSKYHYKIIRKLMSVAPKKLSHSTLSTVNKKQSDLKIVNETGIVWPVARVIVQPDFHDPIQTIGSSIIVDSEGVLILGLAALQACRAQGKTFINAIVIDLNALKKGFPCEIYTTLADFKIPFFVSQQSAIGIALQKKLPKRQGFRADLKEKALLASKNLEKNPSLRSQGDEVRGRTDAWMAKVLNFKSKDEWVRAKNIYQRAPECLILAVDGGKVPISTAARMLKNPEELRAFEQAQASGKAYTVLKNPKKKECHDETLC